MQAKEVKILIKFQLKVSQCIYILNKNIKETVNLFHFNSKESRHSNYFNLEQ